MSDYNNENTIDFEDKNQLMLYFFSILEKLIDSLNNISIEIEKMNDNMSIGNQQLDTLSQQLNQLRMTFSEAELRSENIDAFSQAISSTIEKMSKTKKRS